jgi:hypothetical protein
VKLTVRGTCPDVGEAITDAASGEVVLAEAVIVREAVFLLLPLSVTVRETE